MALGLLREVLSSEYKGPRAVFSEVHVLKALDAIGDAGSLGRGKLGLLLGLGQGEVRTLIKRMREKGLISIEAGGCTLTAKGRAEYRKLKEVIPWSEEVQARPLRLGGECWAVLVRGASTRVKRGLEQRDAAVRGGANGAFTAVFDSGRFRVPGEKKDCESAGPSELWSAIRAASPEEGDVVVISGASEKTSAESGALAAALSLL